MSTDTHSRFICRYVAPELTDFVMVAERPEMPEIGEVLSAPVRRGCFDPMEVAFYVTDLHASASGEEFVMVECEISPIGEAE